jgi:acetyltransferase-like isoleucine patch superfamily enzyme
VTIGDNAVIGAGSVVTKDIPENMIAVGTPAKVVRSIYD